MEGEISGEAISPSYPRLKFEPGIHVTSNDQFWEMYRRYQQGDRNANAWAGDPACVERTVNQHPRLLGIDGLGFGLSDNGITPTSTDQQWFFLPATPAKLRPSEKSVYIILGDDLGLGGAFPAQLNTLPFRDALNGLDRQGEKTAALDENIEVGAEAIMALVAVGLGAHTVNRISKGRMSRRSFIRLGLAASAALGLTGRIATRAFSQSSAATTSDEGQKQFWLEVAGHTTPLIHGSDWVRVHTALVILKTKDAIDELNLKNEPTAIVMGAGHTAYAGEMMDDESKAVQAVRDWAEKAYTIVRQYIPQESERNNAIKRINEYLAAFFIQKIDEPPATNNLPSAVVQSIHTVGRMQSKRISAALQK